MLPETPRPLPRLEVLIEEFVGNRFGSGVYRRWVEGLGLARSACVLEVGCGAGACARHLAEVVPDGRLVCLDSDARWLARAEQRLHRAPQAEFVCADICAWQAPGEFDDVVVHFMLHDIAAHARPRAIASIAASLRPGGALCLREPLGEGMAEAELDELLAEGGLELLGEKRVSTVPAMGPTVSGRWRRPIAT